MVQIICIYMYSTGTYVCKICFEHKNSMVNWHKWDQENKYDCQMKTTKDIMETLV